MDRDVHPLPAGDKVGGSPIRTGPCLLTTMAAHGMGGREYEGTEERMGTLLGGVPPCLPL